MLVRSGQSPLPRDSGHSCGLALSAIFLPSEAALPCLLLPVSEQPCYHVTQLLATGNRPELGQYVPSLGFLYAEKFSWPQKRKMKPTLDSQ